jgi:hypothetical protein
VDAIYQALQWGVRGHSFFEEEDDAAERRPTPDAPVRPLKR